VTAKNRSRESFPRRRDRQSALYALAHENVFIHEEIECGSASVYALDSLLVFLGFKVARNDCQLTRFAFSLVFWREPHQHAPAGGEDIDEHSTEVQVTSGRRDDFPDLGSNRPLSAHPERGKNQVSAQSQRLRH
jgi:hypothetical protein